MKRKFSQVACIILVTLATGCRHGAPAPVLDDFRMLPPHAAVYWQLDLAALRRALVPLPPELSQAERISGIIINGQAVAVIDGEIAAPRGMEIKRLDAGHVAVGAAQLLAQLPAHGDLPDVSPIPAESQFWLIADPQLLAANQTFALHFGKTTVEMPAEIVTHARRIWGTGSASAMGLTLEIAGEYPDASDPAQFAPQLQGFLGLVRNFKPSAAAAGNRIVVRANLGATEVAKMFWDSWKP